MKIYVAYTGEGYCESAKSLRKLIRKTIEDGEIYESMRACISFGHIPLIQWFGKAWADIVELLDIDTLNRYFDGQIYFKEIVVKENNKHGK